jgi:hypothetical protein
MSDRLETLGMGRHRIGTPPVPGDLVGVYIFGRWRQGKILHVGPKRALIEYATPAGVKRRRQSWFPVDVLRRGEP